METRDPAQRDAAVRYASYDLAGEKRSLLAQVDEVEKVVEDCIGRIASLEVQVKAIVADRDAHGVLVEKLEAENKRLKELLQKQHEVISGSYNYASAVDLLQKQLGEVKGQAQAEQMRFEEVKTSLTRELGLMQHRLSEAQNASELEVTSLKGQMDALAKEHAVEIQLKDHHIASLQRDLDLVRDEFNQFRTEANERLFAQEKQIEGQARELSQAKREQSATTAMYEQRLQKARMQYEEHLLQVTAKAGMDAPQEEYWRKKIAQQKRDYEAQLAELRKKLEEAQSAASRNALMREAASQVGQARSSSRQARATTLTITTTNGGSL